MYVWLTVKAIPDSRVTPRFFHGQPQLKEKELVENQGAIGGILSFLKPPGIGIAVGEVDPSERVREGQESLAPRHFQRQGALHAGRILVHYPFHYLPQSLLVESLGEGVDRHHAAETDRIPGHDRCHRFSLGQPFGVRMMHLALESKLRDQSGKYAPPPLLPGLLEKGGIKIEPFEGDGAACIPHHHFEEATPPLGAHHVSGNHLAGKDTRHSGAKPCNGHHLAAVLVTVGKKIEGILHRGNPLLAKGLRQLRTDPFYELNGSFQVLAVDGLMESALDRTRRRRGMTGQEDAARCLFQ